MYQTPLRKCGSTWVRAEFGLSKIGDQEPYASLTGEEYSSPRMTEKTMLACGQIRDRLDTAFPELRAFAKWHLCTDGIPMHYIANAKFWHDMHNGLQPRKDYDPDPSATFASHALIGVLRLEENAAWLLARPWAQCEVKLRAREPGLREAFKREVIDKLEALAVALGASAVGAS